MSENACPCQEEEEYLCNRCAVRIASRRGVSFIPGPVRTDCPGTWEGHSPHLSRLDNQYQALCEGGAVKYRIQVAACVLRDRRRQNDSRPDSVIIGEVMGSQDFNAFVRQAPRISNSSTQFQYRAPSRPNPSAQSGQRLTTATQPVPASTQVQAPGYRAQPPTHARFSGPSQTPTTIPPPYDVASTPLRPSLPSFSRFNAELAEMEERDAEEERRREASRQSGQSGYNSYYRQ